MLPATRLRAEEFARALDDGIEPGPSVARLVTLARTLPTPGIALHTDTRARQRAHLTALAAAGPRPAEEALRGAEAAPDQPRVAQPRPGLVRSPQRRRAPQWASPRRVSFATGFAAVLVAIAGMLVGGARSLPGDPLYGVKRATESARLAATLDQVDRGRLHFSIAQDRIGEVDRLLARSGLSGLRGTAGDYLAASTRPAAQVPARDRRAVDGQAMDFRDRRIAATLVDMAEHATAGSRDLTRAWQESGDDKPLTLLRAYSRQGFDQLLATTRDLPESAHSTAVQSVAARSLTLLVLVRDRADKLTTLDASCDEECREGDGTTATGTGVGTDALGAAPCSGACPDQGASTALPVFNTATMSEDTQVLAAQLATLVDELDLKPVPVTSVPSSDVLPPVPPDLLTVSPSVEPLLPTPDLGTPTDPSTEPTGPPTSESPTPDPAPVPSPPATSPPVPTPTGETTVPPTLEPTLEPTLQPSPAPSSPPPSSPAPSSPAPSSPAPSSPAPSSPEPTPEPSSPAATSLDPGPSESPGPQPSDAASSPAPASTAPSPPPDPSTAPPAPGLPTSTPVEG